MRLTGAGSDIPQMNTHSALSKQLNRAYVQGKVIEANLEHLRVVLADGNDDLRDGLKPFAHSFGQYVRALNKACATAEAETTIKPG
jgi:hypothetical protein